MLRCAASPCRRECLTAKLPYQGLTAVQAAVGVVQHGLRPEIPRGTPPAVAELVRACWAAVPEQRPPFTAIEAQLEGLLAAARGAEADAARPAPPPAATSRAVGGGGGAPGLVSQPPLARVASGRPAPTYAASAAAVV